MTADFCDTSFRRQISAQNHKPTSCLQRSVERGDYFLVWSLDGRRGLFANRLSGDRHRIFVQLLPAQQAVSKQTNSPGTMHVCSDELPGRLQVTQQRRTLADPLEIINLQRNSS